MKANAPEKIYLVIDPVWGSMSVNYNRNDTNNIEYTRTDAFIEKAVEWIKEHKEAVETEDNGIMGWIPDYFIEDFVKFMRE